MLSTSIVPYTLKILKTHIEVSFQPPIVDGTWSEINELGNHVVEELNLRKNPACIMDLSELTYMGSSVVALLVRLWKEVKAKNGKMVIVTNHPMVKEIIELAGLDKIWAIYPIQNAARKSLGVPLVLDSSSSSGGILKSKGKLILLLAVVVIIGIGIGYYLNQSLT